MVKFKGETKDGRPVYGLGLSHENLARLKKGQPIKCSLEDMGGVGDIFIFAGKDEAEMVRNLSHGAPVTIEMSTASGEIH